MAATAPVSSTLYNNLPLIEDVAKIDDRHLIALAGIFETHGCHGRFAIARLHRHFDLEHGDAPVHHSDSRKDVCKIERPRAEVYPMAWLYNGGSLKPYEFSQSSGSIPDGKFAEEFGGYLMEHGLQDTLGISVAPPSDARWKEVLSPDGTGTISTRDDGDFENSTDPVTEWISEKTDGRIQVRWIKRCEQDVSGAHFVRQDTL